MILLLTTLSALIQLPVGISGVLVAMNSRFIHLAPPPPFTGNLSQNNRLQNAIYLAKGKVRGPEVFEFGKDGLIYTGLATGEVVSVGMDGSVRRVALIGNVTNEGVCKLSGTGVPKLNPECGRPLGLRLRGNILYVADAFFGIVKIDITNGQKTIVLSSEDPRFGDKPMKLTNDLDVDNDGVIYFVDTSYLRDMNELLEEHIEAQPRGRLFSFNQNTNELKLLLKDIFFPNGMQLTPEQDALLIDENTMSRIIKYQIRGNNKGKVEIFANLPGLSDTIRLSSKQTLLVPFVVSRYSNIYSLLDLFGDLPLVRDLIGSVGKLINIESAYNYIPKYGLLVEYDLNGKILRSWHDPSGKIIDSISGAGLYGNKLYIGSFYKDYIAVIDY